MNKRRCKARSEMVFSSRRAALNNMKTIEQIRAEYKENEEYNSHAENVVLLAENFGTMEEKEIAIFNLELRNRMGYASNIMADTVYQISKRLYAHIKNA